MPPQSGGMEMVMSDQKKKKKEKTEYLDDGRQISDMSGVPGGMFSSLKRKKSNNGFQPTLGQSPLQTYLAAMRMMFLPMLAVIGCICVAFLILYLLMRFT